MSYKDACFNSPTRINNPAHSCSFEICAAAYNWKKAEVQKWYLENVIIPALDYADGVWLDGIGPDNGAYMCSGECCGYGAHNSPHNQEEIAAQCAGMLNASTAVEEYLVQHEAYEVQKCFQYTSGAKLPNAKDSPSQCAKKLQQRAAVGANHSNYNAIVAYAVGALEA
jgi:hypothetical protein